MNPTPQSPLVEALSAFVPTHEYDIGDSELRPNEKSRWLSSLLQEYSTKLNDMLEKLTNASDKVIEHHFQTAGKPSSPSRVTIWGRECGRIICLLDTVVPMISNVCRQASGLIESSTLDSVVRTELKVRLDETEESVRFSRVIIEEVSGILQTHGVIRDVRQAIEKTRYKSPI